MMKAHSKVCSGFERCGGEIAGDAGNAFRGEVPLGEGVLDNGGYVFGGFADLFSGLLNY